MSLQDAHTFIAHNCTFPPFSSVTPPIRISRGIRGGPSFSSRCGFPPHGRVEEAGDPLNIRNPQRNLAQPRKKSRPPPSLPFCARFFNALVSALPRPNEITRGIVTHRGFVRYLRSADNIVISHEKQLSRNTADRNVRTISAVVHGERNGGIERNCAGRQRPGGGGGGTGRRIGNCFEHILAHNTIGGASGTYGCARVRVQRTVTPAVRIGPENFHAPLSRAAAQSRAVTLGVGQNRGNGGSRSWSRLSATRARRRIG